MVRLLPVDGTAFDDAPEEAVHLGPLDLGRDADVAATAGGPGEDRSRDGREIVP